MSNHVHINQVLVQSITSVIQQGRPCVAERFEGVLRPCYRNEEGHTCAVGAIIKPTLYEFAFDRKNLPIDHPNIVGAIGLSVGRQLSKKELDWLQLVQHAHDSSFTAVDFVKEFKAKLKLYIECKWFPKFLEEELNAASVTF